MDWLRIIETTICRKLEYTDNSSGHKTIKYAHVQNLTTGATHRIKAKIFIVAANTVNTPQLLWASNIRPPALGRFMYDHALVYSWLMFNEETMKDIKAKRDSLPPDITKHHEYRLYDPIPIPINDLPIEVMIPVQKERPWQAVIELSALTLCLQNDIYKVDNRLVFSFHSFGQMSPHPDNRIVFSEKYKDMYEMPQPTLLYKYSDRDKKLLHNVIVDQENLAHVLGGFIPGGAPQILEPGKATHVMGTYRMGAKNTDEYVCDPHSRVWETENLFLGGMGLVSTPTACNPTLTLVALALYAADHILKLSSKAWTIKPQYTPTKSSL